MAAKIIAVISAFAFIHAVNSQVIRGPFNQILPITETVCPNQVYLNPGIFPVGPNIINYDLPCGCGCETILSSPVTVPSTTTIIQDSTVANNLANALQLLVVSNLLSNTLPYMGADVVVPSCNTCNTPIALPGYNYIY